MTLAIRLESALESVVARAGAEPAPPSLAGAIRYAVFPGGARVRPLLCLAVSEACGGGDPALSDATAAAIELLHCASLVHDDLPCFDDAGLRRGKPTVHARFGVPIALLAGDAMIVQAFDTLARAAAASPQRLAPVLSAVAQGVGMPNGLCAGQAWESEPHPNVEAYHSAKTGALFVAATTAGALSAGADPGPWRALGEHLGAAYQVADDLLDAVGDSGEFGKPTGQDAALMRPSIVAKLGLQGAYARLDQLVQAAVAAIPRCDGDKALRDLVRMQATRLAPKRLPLTA